MNKRIVAGMLFTTVVCMMLGGCGFTADKENVKNSGAVESVMPGAEVSTEMTERDAEADNGVVQLKSMVGRRQLRHVKPDDRQL